MNTCAIAVAITIAAAVASSSPDARNSDTAMAARKATWVVQIIRIQRMASAADASTEYKVLTAANAHSIGSYCRRGIPPCAEQDERGRLHEHCERPEDDRAGTAGNDERFGQRPPGTVAAAAHFPVQRVGCPHQPEAELVGGERHERVAAGKQPRGRSAGQAGNRPQRQVADRVVPQVLAGHLCGEGDELPRHGPVEGRPQRNARPDQAHQHRDRPAGHLPHRQPEPRPTARWWLLPTTKPMREDVRSISEAAR